MYVNDVVLTVVESGCGRPLFIRDGLVTAIADPHFELEPHQRDGGALGAAFAADGFPTLPTVMLPEAYFLTVPHLLEVPEERLVTFLTGVTIQPLWGLLPLNIHVPDDNSPICSTGDELPSVVSVGERLNFIVMSLQLDGCSFSSSNIPHYNGMIRTARE